MNKYNYKFPLIARSKMWGYEVTFESEDKGYISNSNSLVDHVKIGEYSDRWISCFDTDVWTILSHNLNKPTLEELRRQEKEIQDKIKELEAESGDWPKIGDVCLAFNFFELEVVDFTFVNCDWDNRSKSIGNVHPTEQAAKEWGEKWINRMKEEINKK